MTTNYDKHLYFKPLGLVLIRFDNHYISFLTIFLVQIGQIKLVALN